MKKFPLFLLLIIVLAGLAGADFYLNGLAAPGPIDLSNFQPTTVADIPRQEAAPPAVTGSVFQLSQSVDGYAVEAQLQTKQIFEKIDLSSIGNIKVYRHELMKSSAPAAETPGAGDSPSVDTPQPLLIYEILGPEGQGSLTYLNVKLQFIAQIDAVTETLNETGQFGHNSFFYNDANYQNTAFLLVQVKDHLYGFQYNKSVPEAYEDVQRLITDLVSGALSSIIPNYQQRV